MKLKRFLSGLLFGMGCALTFVGLLAVVLPSISNTQMQLVIASFSAPSDRPAVNLINRFMSFAFSQNWRLFLIGLMIAAVGAWLLILFTPRKKQPKPIPVRREARPAPEQSAPEPEPEPVAEAPNPFAAGRYASPQEEPPAARQSPALYAKPMLEQNTITETETYRFVPDLDAKPYFSPRLETESRAVQASLGDESQSGSRILIRPVPVVASVPEPEPVKEVIAEPVPQPVPAPKPAVPTPKPAVPAPSMAATAPASSRIRSTMGRHTALSGKLPPRS